MTHLAAFVLGILSTLALLHLLARRVAHPRPFRRSRVAIRESDYVRLYRQIDDAIRQLDELDAARSRRPPIPSIDWIAQVNACLDPEDGAA